MTQAASTRPDALAVLEDRGYRSTGTRRDIVSLLETKEEGFSAEEICEELPGVGRATVYRTIRLLLDTGLVCKLALPDGAPKYSLARLEHHHHTMCVRCGTVGEFRDAAIERLLRTIGHEISGDIVGHRIEFYIVCRDCLALVEGEAAAVSPPRFPDRMRPGTGTAAPGSRPPAGPGERR